MSRLPNPILTRRARPVLAAPKPSPLAGRGEDLKVLDAPASRLLQPSDPPDPLLPSAPLLAPLSFPNLPPPPTATGTAHETGHPSPDGGIASPIAAADVRADRGPNDSAGTKPRGCDPRCCPCRDRDGPWREPPASSVLNSARRRRRSRCRRCDPRHCARKRPQRPTSGHRRGSRRFAHAADYTPRSDPWRDRSGSQPTARASRWGSRTGALAGSAC
ncbi:hypothetical protein EKPJFOCH_4283 [Methylobacterium thuringiense]|uniref:Uncharacterized protein n=1 Tax=Methylobacterium thuringiense TaxID=1003091 RepID=A0ABQ4TV54_9HYPH|nr:hypothetical protein EKPJFOCH_4283 [Methylobacterium thuringiense]